jgi:hypothetical protein
VKITYHRCELGSYKFEEEEIHGAGFFFLFTSILQTILALKILSNFLWRGTVTWIHGADNDTLRQMIYSLNIRFTDILFVC